jgi:hypothetical protein
MGTESNCEIVAIQGQDFIRAAFFCGRGMEVIMHPAASHAEAARVRQPGDNFQGGQPHKLKAV